MQVSRVFCTPIAIRCGVVPGEIAINCDSVCPDFCPKEGEPKRVNPKGILATLSLSVFERLYPSKPPAPPIRGISLLPVAVTS